MSITNIILALSTLSCVALSPAFAQQASACTYDYECGNVPYAYCSGGSEDCTSTINGLATDGQYLYYAQQCRTNSIYGNYTFKRIPIGGGVPVNIYSREAIPAEGNPASVLGVVDNYLFFDIFLRQPGRGIIALNLANPTSEQSVSTNSFPQDGVDFDLDSNTPATYICDYVPGSSNYTIDRYPILPASGAVSSSARLYTLPSDEQCGAVARFSDVDLFFTSISYSPVTDSYTTKFYLGSITCSNCSLPTPFFTVQDYVITLAVSGSYVFYGSENGLFRVNMDGSGNVKSSSAGESAIGILIVNNTVIYNNGKEIRAVDFNGGNNVLLSRAPVGACTCRPGFTSSDCSACNGQVQWQPSDPPRPVCASLRADGVPTSCFYAYQCGNVPFTACYSNTCTCISANFTGSRCDVCASPRTLTWSMDGFPSCA